MLRRGFHFADVFELFDDLLHDALPLFDVSHLAAAEHDRHDDLVFVKEEAAGLGDLEFDVVIPRLRTEADFLDLGVMNVGFVVLFLLLILELAEVHDSAHRWLLIRCHLDQIETGVSRERQGVVCGHDPKLTAVGSNDTDRCDPNLLVDAMLLLYGSRLPAAET